MPVFKVKRHRANDEIEIEARNSLEVMEILACPTHSNYEVDFSKKPLTWKCDTGEEFYTCLITDVDEIGKE